MRDSIHLQHERSRLGRRDPRAPEGHVRPGTTPPPYWRKRNKAGEPVGGRIINTTSGAGLSGNVGQSNYAAAKAGIVGFTLTASIELARLGVTVNCIAPGGADPHHRHDPRRGREVRSPTSTPSGSVGSVDEFPVVAWLASDEAGHVSGQVLRAIGETFSWRAGVRPDDRQRRDIWDATKLGQRLATDVFRTRAPGLRSG